jgi:hypothetical protein
MFPINVLACHREIRIQSHLNPKEKLQNSAADPIMPYRSKWPKEERPKPKFRELEVEELENLSKETKAEVSKIKTGRI